LLALAALGIVFGDIGTSPLYAFQTLFSDPHSIEPSPPLVMGSLSLIFWTITLIVTVKYVLIVMHADNDGEGGIMALTALTMRERFKSPKTLAILVGLGVLGAALFYGDSMITPAISVLSAVEGIEIAAPDLAHLVLPIALVILTGLFAIQRFGTGVVGRLFGPVMLVWFVVIGVAGIASIVGTPEILKSISPTYAIEFFVDDPLTAFLSLGAVILCVTGAEALYADMGHLGAGPIRLAWFVVVTPALYLNYMGQGALVLRDPEADVNPFYLLFPDSLQIAVVVLATLATIIASQAVITGAYSLTVQAMRLRFVPRMAVKHTSAKSMGEVYVPFVNWFIFIAVIGLVLGFRSSANLSAAYGLAVSGTFVITTILISVVARQRWGVSMWIIVPVSVCFLIIDTAFFAANMTKFFHGGYFPVIIAVVLFIIFTTWAQGRLLTKRRYEDMAMEPEQIRAALENTQVARTPGTRVFLSLQTDVPLAFGMVLRNMHSAAENTILISALSEKVPFVQREKRMTVEQVAPGIRHVTVRTGFMQPLWVPTDLVYAKKKGVDLTGDVTFIVYSPRIEAVGNHGMMKWRKELFSFMSKNSRDPARYFHLPEAHVVEVSSVVRI